MKAKLVFELPDDRAAHERSVHGTDYVLALWDLDQWLRSMIRHGKITEEAADAMQECRDKMYEFLEARGVSLEDGLE